MYAHRPYCRGLVKACFLGIFCICLSATAKEATEDRQEDALGNEEGTTSGPPGKSIMHFDHLLGGQYAPLGMLYELNPYFRWDLFPGSDNILLEDAHIKAGMNISLSPACAFYGPSFTIAPLTILHINVQFTHVIYGVVGSKLGLLDYNNEEGGQYANYDYAYRNSQEGYELGAFTADVWSLFIKPSLFIQVGPIVFVYLGNYMYLHPTEFEGLYYNDIVDLILTEKSWSLMNDAMLLYEIKNLKKDGYGILLGVDNQINIAVDDGTPRMETAYRWKLGITAGWTITDQLLDYAIEEPTLFLQAHYFMKDPIMSGHERPVGIILAFMMSTNWYKE